VDGLHFIAMELLEGQTLEQWLGGRPLPIALLVDVAIQIADAFEAAHGRGIVHRDVKPPNLFVTRRGQAKVLDFGVATLVDDQRLEPAAADTESGTVAGKVVGTIAYMSPEQAVGERLDARTDLLKTI
jgi:serine/threonine protein kinase